MSNKLIEAYNITKQFRGDNSKKWEKVEDYGFLENIFISTNPNEVVKNGFKTSGKKGKFVVVGLYEDRYYTDEDSYTFDSAFYLTFGTMDKDSVVTALTVTEAELRKDLNMNLSMMLDKEPIKELYEFVSLSIMDSQDFLNDF